MVHQLSGPFAIEGAQPGDLLVVDILDVGPVPQESGPVAGQGWGYTGLFAKSNGGGLVTDWFPEAYKAVWDFTGQKATSRHIPGVEFTGLIHPGFDGNRAERGPARQLERPRRRTDRDGPRTCSATGVAAAARPTRFSAV